MPFDTLAFFPAHWVSPHSILQPSADNRAAPDFGSRLDTLPNELLLDIARRLDKRATLALSETSQRFPALLQDALVCIRLERDIRHVVTPRQLANIATRILDVKPRERAALIRQLGIQRNQLHPLLRQNPQPALDMLAPPNTFAHVALQLDWERERESMRRLGPGNSSQHEPLLSALQQLPCTPCERVRLLIQWLSLTGDAGARRVTSDVLRAISQLLPANGAAAFLGTLVAIVSPSDTGRWCAVLHDAVAFAQKMQPSSSAARLSLLSTVATALGDDRERSTECLVRRRELWQRLLTLLPELPELPDAARRDLLNAVAQYPSYELMHGKAEQLGPDTVPAWKMMVDTLMPRSDSTDGVVDVVCTLLDQVGQRPWTGRPQQLTTALLKRASALTEGERARVLHSAIVFGVDGLDGDEDRYQYWRTALKASDNLPLPFQALPLVALAGQIENGFEAFVAEHHNAEAAREPVLWNLLFDRVMQLPEQSRLAPALALTDAATEIDDPGQCTAKLVLLAETLLAADRSHLLSVMLTKHCYTYCDPELWGRLVTLILNLPAAVQPQALRSLVITLVNHHDVMEEVSPDTSSLELGPGDSQLGVWPESIQEAHELASKALALLPAHAVGGLLVEMAKSPNGTDNLRWTLRAIASFRPNNIEYKAAIVTKVCARLAQGSHPVGVLDDVWPMVKSIPTRLRASALQYVRDFLAIRAPDDAWDEIVERALDKMQLEDQPRDNVRKRKFIAL